MSFIPILLTSLLCSGGQQAASPARPPQRSASAQAVSPSGGTLPVVGFADLYVPDGDRLVLSDKIKSLAGKRVKVVGFMAKFEELDKPITGAFYLCPQPMTNDESGAGIGDLPVNAIRVTVSRLAGKPVAHQRGALIVTGKLEVGSREEPEGLFSFVRIVADPAPTPPRAGQPRKDAKPASHTKKTKQ